MHTMPAEVHGHPIPDWASRLEVRLVRPSSVAHFDGCAPLFRISRLGRRSALLCRLSRRVLGRPARMGSSVMNVSDSRPMDRMNRPPEWARLRLVVNHARFLILPGVQIPNLASKILALNTRRLATDWDQVYGHPVAVVETFVDPAHFAGTSYRAAGWSRSRGDAGIWVTGTSVFSPWASQNPVGSSLTPGDGGRPGRSISSRHVRRRSFNDGRYGYPPLDGASATDSAPSWILGIAEVFAIRWTKCWS